MKIVAYGLMVLLLGITLAATNPLLEKVDFLVRLLFYELFTIFILLVSISFGSIDRQRSHWKRQKAGSKWVLLSFWTLNSTDSLPFKSLKTQTFERQKILISWQNCYTLLFCCHLVDNLIINNAVLRLCLNKHYQSTIYQIFWQYEKQLKFFAFHHWLLKGGAKEENFRQLELIRGETGVIEKKLFFISSEFR